MPSATYRTGGNDEEEKERRGRAARRARRQGKSQEPLTTAVVRNRQSRCGQAVGKEGRQRMREEKLPRGIKRRGDSLVAVFALADGKIERRSLGEVSVTYAREQLHIYRRQVREGTYQKRVPRPKHERTIGDLWKSYIDAYHLAGTKAAWRQEGAWKNHLKEVFEAMHPERLTT